MAQLTIVDRLGSGSFGYVMRIKQFYFLETGDFDKVSLDLCFPLTIMPLECMLLFFNPNFYQVSILLLIP